MLEIGLQGIRSRIYFNRCMPEVEFKSWNLSPGELSSSVAHDGNYYEGGQTGVFQVVMLSLREV